MDTFDTKSAFRSKGVWGSLAAIAGVLLPVALKALKLDGVIAPDDVINLASQVVAVGGAALALYGRVTAKKAIG